METSRPNTPGSHSGATAVGLLTQNPDPPRWKFAGPWFWALLLAYVAYALGFIFRSSVVLSGKRYFLLLDDAMISMTYARNIAAGAGPVWFPGYEAVQGFSNPLWTLYMAAWHLVPIAPELRALPVQLTGVVVLVALLFVVREIARMVAAELPGVPAGPISLFSVLLTAFYLPLNEWTLRGMEVGVIALGIAAAAFGALRTAAGRADFRWWVFPLLGLLTGVRLDAALAGMVIVGWLAWALPARRASTLLFGLGSIGLCIAAQLLLSRHFFGDPLPNTYYLKISGVPLGRRVVWGAYVLYCFLAGLGLWLWVPIGVLGWTMRAKSLLLLLLLFAGQAAYSVYVGGDSWEWWGGANRFIAVAMPGLFVAIAASLVWIAARTGALGSASTTGPRASFARSGVVAALGFLTLLQVNSYEFARTSSIFIALLGQQPHELDTHEQSLRAALILQKNSAPTARIAVAQAGVLPYFSERPCIDLLGKCDRFIAKGPNTPPANPPFVFLQNAPLPYCWPGHTKFNYTYSLREPMPDLVQLWSDMGPVEELLRRNYVTVTLGGTKYLLLRNTTAIRLRSPGTGGPPAAEPGPAASSP